MKSIEEFPEYLFKQTQACDHEVPQQAGARRFIDDLVSFLFPIRADEECVLPQIRLNLLQLQIDFQKLLRPLKRKLAEPIGTLSDQFFDRIPSIYASLMKDAKSFLDFDPAARSIESVILYYPGFYGITVYRLANVLYSLGIPFLPRMVSEYAHAQTGIDIHPGATIGDNFLIDHGTGVVIGETAIIGRDVKIYQGVTLGALFVKKELANTKRHPTIEDNVVIYGGSTILGGQTVVGHDSTIGGNVWLTKSVPSNSIVYHDSTTIVKDSKRRDEPLDFVI
ncbi:MAG: serine acetyltransferase [Planctomycetes bacterium]|nr:serine acetyltransferase [Planctomycetota bacterium]